MIKLYTIICNKSYVQINSGSNYTNVKELNQATIFDSFNAANQFLTNHIPKKIRYKYKIVNCEDLILSDKLLSTMTLNKVQSKTNDLIEANLQMLNNALSLMDKKQQDILHHIELTPKFNMYQCWKIISKLRTVRIKRRRIKKAMLTLTTFRQSMNLEHLYLTQCESNNYNDRVIDDFDKYIISDEDES